MRKEATGIHDRAASAAQVETGVAVDAAAVSVIRDQALAIVLHDETLVVTEIVAVLAGDENGLATSMIVVEARGISTAAQTAALIVTKAGLGIRRAISMRHE